MGLFGQSTPFDAEIDKATSETNTNENWSLILDVCDKVVLNPRLAKECLKAIMKRMNHADPHVVMQAITLLDACASNCGKPFHLEIASREFENEFRRLLIKAQPKVSLKMRQVLKNWADDFKNDTELNLIPSLYNKLRQEGYEFSNLGGEKPSKATSAAKLTALKDPNVVSSQQEEDDIAKAIELSLKETKNSPKQQAAAAATTTGAGGSSVGASAGAASATSAYPSLYPSFAGSGSLGSITSGAAAAANNSGGVSQPEPRKVRALYDFEAAEENELTFFAGEILHVLDDSDPNWWKGFNQRGDGLFPSNFVSADLSVDPERLDINVQQQQQQKTKKTVQFEDDARELQQKTEAAAAAAANQRIEIDEDKVGRLLHLLHEANPEDPSQDSDEMLRLEQEVNQMGPLIDAELERVDRKHAQLTQLSSDLVDAINLYHSLMRDDRAALLGGNAGTAFMGGMLPPGMAGGYANSQMQFGALPQGGVGAFSGGGGNFAPPQMSAYALQSLPPYAAGQMTVTTAPTATSASGVYAPHAQHQLQLGNEAAPQQQQQLQMTSAVPMQFQNGHVNAPQMNGTISALPPHMNINSSMVTGQQQQQHQQQPQMYPGQQQQQQQAPSHQQNYQMLPLQQQQQPHQQQQQQHQQQYNQSPQTIAGTGSPMPPNATAISNNPQQQQHTAPPAPQQQFMSPQHQQQQHAAAYMQHLPQQQQQFAPMPNGPQAAAAYMMQPPPGAAGPVNQSAADQYNQQLHQQMAALSMGGVNQPVTQNFLVQNEPKNNIPIYQQQR